MFRKLSKSVLPFLLVALTGPIYSDEVNPTLGLSKYGRFINGGHPDHLKAGTLKLHLYWCAWHEGIDPYAINHERPPGSFQYDCDKAQEHNKTAQKMIFDASPAEMEEASKEIHQYFNLPGNGGYEMVKIHLCWTRAQYFPEVEADESSSAEVRSLYFEGRERVGGKHELNLLTPVRDQVIQYMIAHCG